jgi:hypothetical protein
VSVDAGECQALLGNNLGKHLLGVVEQFFGLVTDGGVVEDLGET